MERECETMNLPIPEYNVDKGSVEVTFRLPEKKDKDTSVRMSSDKSKLTAVESKVYDIVCEGNFNTAMDISKIIGMSERTVRRALARLIELGYVERIGGNKQGKWVPVSISK